MQQGWMAAHLLFVFSIAAALGATCSPIPPPVLPALPAAPTSGAISYSEQVQPVLESRCVVCHGCYDAPCQLQLSSFEGLERGGTKQTVYHGSRLHAMEPTRLFTDAHTTAEWREREFFSVLESTDSGSQALLLNMLALGRARPFAPDEKLPAQFPLDITRELSCPTAAEFDEYAAKQPLGGMPYGVAPLDDAELGVLAAWVEQGAPGPPAPPGLPRRATAQIAKWEAFLNGESLKQRIVARYLYEHWFVAHLQLEGLAAAPFFRIVRSSTPPGTPPKEIATRRPYDDPGTASFWYRLTPIRSTIVHKTHIVYRLDDARLRRLRELFVDSDWQPTRLPSYETAEASNPFVSFDQIPARARYQFLLDDAQYFVMTFIRGPVCRGQTAVDVIEDRFWVAFLDPDQDRTVTDPRFLEQAKHLLHLPAENESRLVLGGITVQYDLAQREYVELRARHYAKSDPERLGPTLDVIWDGDGKDTNAQLTVFRHFDNATVVRGFLGVAPETAWVIDFPLFERIYYDLVAGFDVFGSVTHQLSTRLYMDHLRMQSENIFLAFLPEDRRGAIQASWYVDAHELAGHRDALESLGHGTRIPFASSDVTAELLAMIIDRSPAVAGPPDLLNRCSDPPCDRPGASPAERRAERALQRIAGVRGPWVATLPDLSFLRVRAGRDMGGDAVYTLVHDKAHTNVASPFAEQDRRQPELDVLTVARGYLGSYPNFLFEVELAEIEAFTQALSGVEDAAGFEQVAGRFGVRRTSPRFWSSFDWIHDDFRRDQPTQAGLFDLARYGNF